MRIDIETAQHHLTWEELASRARLIDDAGFEGLWLFDHYKPLYGESTGDCMEGWTLLAGLSAITNRVRLGTLVTGVTYRHPSILAAEAVTVDHISNGRLDFGLGAAWFDQEHRELGIEFPRTRRRIEQLEDALQMAKLLMTEDEVSFEGKHFRLDNATYHPKPVQRPTPPIWVGASGERVMVPLAGRYADVWHTFAKPDDLKRKAAIVDEAAEAAGRKASDIRRSTNLSISRDWDTVRKRAESYREVGVSILIVSWPTEGRERVEEFVDRVLPELQGL